LSGLFSLACTLLGPAMAGGGEHPTTLAGFGYGFNERGEMRKVDGDTGETTDEPFQFEVRPGDREYNQRHYEAVGEVVTEEVYRLLETAGRLDRLQLLDSDGSFVFVSSDWRSCERLVVLIHGSGVVRAGQWARRLVMNEDLEKGTQLPYIQRAREEGYGVIVMNTNQNTVVRGGGEVEIPGSETPLDHGVTVWQRLVKKSKAKDIVIVAHSFGGVVAVDLAHTFHDDFLSRVSAVLMTDSVHGGLTGDKKVDKKLRKIGRNYVSSSKPLDTPLRDGGGIERVSAGHPQHEWTSWAAMRSIFGIMHEIAVAGEEDKDNVTGGGGGTSGVEKENNGPDGVEKEDAVEVAVGDTADEKSDNKKEEL